MTRNWIDGPPNMDPHAEAIDEFVDPWPVREPAPWFGIDPVVYRTPRHRGRATLKGFILHPVVFAGIIFVSITVLAAIGWKAFS